MHHFAYRAGILHAEDIDLNRLADIVGTPFYCYSEATIRRHARVFAAAFAELDPLVAYSVKANGNLAILSVLAREGLGADVVSGGELLRARRAGIPGSKIVFSGVGKTRGEMALALDEGIHQFNVESLPELDALNEVALSKGAVAPIAFRINPDVKAGGHAKISTGKAEDKFGVPWARAREIYAYAATLKGVAPIGVDCHIGSQIDALQPFEDAFRRLAALVGVLRADGRTIERLDLGGGLGIPYVTDAAAPPHPEAYAQLVKAIAGPLDVALIFEPGRLIIGNAGVLVATVLYVKDGEARKFTILDAGMNDLMRPALYDAKHEIWPVAEPRAAPTEAYDVVGPVCESTDVFLKATRLPPLRAGDRVVIMSAGAYGAVLSNQYNARPLVPEVLVSNGCFAIVRRRPDFSDMTALETSEAQYEKAV